MVICPIICNIVLQSVRVFYLGYLRWLCTLSRKATLSVSLFVSLLNMQNLEISKLRRAYSFKSPILERLSCPGKKSGIIKAPPSSHTHTLTHLVRVSETLIVYKIITTMGWGHFYKSAKLRRNFYLPWQEKPPQSGSTIKKRTCSSEKSNYSQLSISQSRGSHANYSDISQSEFSVLRKFTLRDR